MSSSFLELHAGSVELEPLVNGASVESSGNATRAGDPVNGNDAGRREAPAVPAPAANAARRRRLVGLSEGQIFSRHCMKRSRNCSEHVASDVFKDIASGNLPKSSVNPWESKVF